MHNIVIYSFCKIRSYKREEISNNDFLEGCGVQLAYQATLKKIG
jgi:hypothetical protein